MEITRELVLDIVRVSTERARAEFTAQIQELTLALNRLKPPCVEPYQPVAINPLTESGNASLDLVKSLPEFSGDASCYPAWRSAAAFAINYYPEGSEKYYVAMGIFRNKITGAANSTLSSFNTVLNFKAIIARLDQTYADKRPVHVLETELSILRQGHLSIADYYDSVDKHLTLIINKQIMTNSGNDEVIKALNDRARANALRVFISGLRRPLCDILFSSSPKDLPTALAVAQELEMNHKRYDFAQTFAMGSSVKPNKVRATMPQYNFNSQNEPNRLPNHNNRPSPMDVDHGTSIYRKINATQNSAIISKTPNQAVVFKRSREPSGSSQRPGGKTQRVNYMPDNIGIVSDESENAEHYDDYDSSNFKSYCEEPYHTCDSKNDSEINFLN